MANRSKFPQMIDTFIEHYDISPSDLPSIARFEVLKAKGSLTNEENEELNTLTNTLRNKLWTAEDLNKIQDATTNMQTFFKNQTEVYVNNLFAQYDGRMKVFDTRVDNMQNQVNTAVGQANTKVAEVDGWWNQIKSGIQARDYFDFDNWYTFDGVAYNTSFGGNTITDTIRHKGNNGLFAQRATTFNSNGTIVENVKVYDGNTVILNKTITTTFGNDGNVNATM